VVSFRREFFCIRGVLALHIGHQIDELLQNPVRNLMDEQMIEFWASYKYGIETDLTGSHLDDYKVGLNPLLLSPETLVLKTSLVLIIQPVIVIASHQD
jgi:hypothetical protein